MPDSGSVGLRTMPTGRAVPCLRAGHCTDSAIPFKPTRPRRLEKDIGPPGGGVGASSRFRSSCVSRAFFSRFHDLPGRSGTARRPLARSSPRRSPALTGSTTRSASRTCSSSGCRCRRRPRKRFQTVAAGGKSRQRPPCRSPHRPGGGRSGFAGGRSASVGPLSRRPASAACGRSRCGTGRSAIVRVSADARSGEDASCRDHPAVSEPGAEAPPRRYPKLPKRLLRGNPRIARRPAWARLPRYWGGSFSVRTPDPVVHDRPSASANVVTSDRPPSR